MHCYPAARQKRTGMHVDVTRRILDVQVASDALPVYVPRCRLDSRLRALMLDDEQIPGLSAQHHRLRGCVDLCITSGHMQLQCVGSCGIVVVKVSRRQVHINSFPQWHLQRHEDVCFGSLQSFPGKPRPYLLPEILTLLLRRR